MPAKSREAAPRHLPEGSESDLARRARNARARLLSSLRARVGYPERDRTKTPSPSSSGLARNLKEAPSMKTILSSGILGFLSVVFLACGGEDSLAGDPADTIADDAADSADDVANAADTDDDAEPAPGVEAPPVAVTPPPSETIDVTLEAAPVLSWRSCGQFQDRNLECAEVIVPIDYAQPDGETLPIALRRILADPLEPYKGALLINPGGPGGPGIDFALDQFQAGVFDAIAPGYDIVGFDPRGVGQSGERGCGILPEEMYPDVSDGAEITSIVENQLALIRERGEQCEQAWGTLFHHLGSKNVVRDMDEIRKALKQPVLNYYGASYGTRLGALYAHTFPETTGRLVLDAAMLPRSTMVENIRGQFYEVVRLHDVIFTFCEANPDVCPTDSRMLFDQMLSNARAGGFEGAFLGLWRGMLGDPSGPDVIISVLNNEAADPGGTWFEAFVLGNLGIDGGSGRVAFTTVMCIDDPLEPPTVAEVESLYAEFYAVSPLYANEALSAVNCAGWPTTRDPIPMPTAVDVSQPILVIGGTADAKTPYEWAPVMTETLGNATLLTSQHFGHGAVDLVNECVISNVRAYLTSGSMPATGTLCE
jgi:pimeloyl-ACP methyl ester carboxylesterase